jgi:putative membrane protein
LTANDGTREAHHVRLADASSRLALVRTRLAHDRTMLSWVRTATSLITFGFGVHQVFRIAPGSVPEGLRDTTPYLFGSAMVGIGLMTLVFAALENRSATAALDSAYPVSEGYPPPPRSHAGMLGACIGLLGIGALILMNIGR